MEIKNYNDVIGDVVKEVYMRIIKLRYYQNLNLEMDYF